MPAPLEELCNEYWRLHNVLEAEQTALWRERRGYDPGPTAVMPQKSEQSDKMAEGFGYKSGWLAIRSDSTESVALSLGVREPEWRLWPEGIMYSSQYLPLDHAPCFIAVTPPICGWVLVKGSDFIDLLFEFYKDPHALDEVSALSGIYREAQLFATLRTAGANGWACWRDGRLIRFCAHCDYGSMQIGEPTLYEMKRVAPNAWERDPEFFILDEDMVIDVAGAWSVSPIKLEELDGLKGTQLLTGWIPPVNVKPG